MRLNRVFGGNASMFTQCLFKLLDTLKNKFENTNLCFLSFLVKELVYIDGIKKKKSNEPKQKFELKFHVNLSITSAYFLIIEGFGVR